STGRNKDATPSNPHRHQHIERGALLALADQRRRVGIGEMQLDAVTVDLTQNVGQVASVEADLHRIAVIARCQLLGRSAVLGAGDAERDAILVEPDLYRARLLTRDGRDTIHALEEALGVDL